MQSEFEQLLEDLLDGRLDHYGRRRLSELCAANPALDRRLRQEQNLNNLLSHCGPNHAPDDLAYAVLAQLEPRRSAYIPRRRTPWFAWIFRPAVGAALAFCVMAAIGIEAGILIHQLNGPGGDGSGPGSSRSVNVLLDSKNKKGAQPARNTRKSTSGRDYAYNPGKSSRPTPALRRNPNLTTAGHAPVPAPAPTQVPAVPQTNLRTEEFNPAAPAAPDSVVAMNTQTPQAPVNSAVSPSSVPSASEGMPGVVTTQAQPAATPAVPLPAGTPAAVPGAAVPAPVAVAQAPAVAPTLAKEKGVIERRAPVRQDFADRQVAMEIFLTPSTRRPEAEASAPSRAANPMPSYAQSFVPESESKPRPQALSLKDIEVTLYAILGVDSPEKVSKRQLESNRNVWEVRVRLTPEQFRTFTADLRHMSILPGESVVGDQETRAQAASHAPSFTTNHYEVLRGKQWFTPQAAKEAIAATGQASGTSAPQKRGAARTRPTADGKLEITIRVQQVAGAPIR